MQERITTLEDFLAMDVRGYMVAIAQAAGDFGMDLPT